MSEKTPTATAAVKDPHVSADGHRPTKAEIWRLGIGFTFSAVICAIPWVALSSLVLPAVLQNIDPDTKETMLGVINAIGSIVALLANFIFGALSDNTRSRFGRRTRGSSPAASSQAFPWASSPSARATSSSLRSSGAWGRWATT